MMMIKKNLNNRDWNKKQMKILKMPNKILIKNNFPQVILQRPKKKNKKF